MNTNKNQGMLVIGGVVVAAVVVLVVAIAISGNANASSIDYSALNPSRNADGAFVIGDPNAPITLVEFADFGCPHCQTYHTNIQRFINEFVVTGQARLEYRMFVSAGGQTSEFVHQIAECIDDAQPGAFWDAYDRFYVLAKTGRYFLDDTPRTVVQELGLSYTEVLQCSSDATQGRTDVQFGQNRGVNGTPAIMVRYGDGDAQWINFGGTNYERGAVPYDVIAQVVRAAQTTTASS